MDGREDVPLTNLDQQLFDDARATKRDLVDYFEAVGEQLLGELRDRPLSGVRALRGQKPFMQKNVPNYAPPWVKMVTILPGTPPTAAPSAGRSARTCPRLAGSRRQTLAMRFALH